MFSLPCEVNNCPLRPLRVGSTQSKTSTPIPTASHKSSGVPTPIRYRGFSTGSHSMERWIISNIASRGSPTDKPPIA